ncbi:aminomethyltransferase [Novosphingobium marinum]|uniref:aminomethyltransferase n=1 Tax=Novosphingobium marinum TaxID=1514948 RepID=A0A7Y9XTW3_9SPHN|nr:glycine cleavage system aminomethyltransferase GcvT [Novosphingobium marinum]NYH94392.1 aminomethyltransferase [Novosphingobium marinum]GGC22008.1 aminomethyltransferase [Novosphingobium marinum]
MNDNSDEDIEPQAPLMLPLSEWHRQRGGRMVEFAGYMMPVQYEGIIAEHLWTREHAGLFDVSHMGQLIVSGDGAAQALEAVLPGDISALKPGRVRYSLLLNEEGGIIDDLMVTNVSSDDEASYYLVVNGATKWDDIGHLREHLPDEFTLNHLEDRALLALQGPAAHSALDRVFPGVADQLVFMRGTGFEWEGVMVGVGRSGYTGEDGFEIGVPASHAERLADALVALPEVKPVGLGARDSLRLEAGLPLYGHDLTEQNDPVSADLAFAISKRRRAEGGFLGADAVLPLLEKGTPRKRVGLLLDGKMAAREGAPVLSGQDNVGTVTSGGYSPSLERPIAMAYVDSALAEEGTALCVEMRGRELSATVTPMPFVPHRYHR